MQKAELSRRSAEKAAWLRFRQWADKAVNKRLFERRFKELVDKGNYYAVEANILRESRNPGIRGPLSRADVDTFLHCVSYGGMNWHNYSGLWRGGR